MTGRCTFRLLTHVSIGQATPRTFIGTIKHSRPSRSDRRQKWVCAGAVVGLAFSTTNRQQDSQGQQDQQEAKSSALSKKIINFWFDPSMEPKWWKSDPKLDQLIKEEFETYLLHPLDLTPLASIILFDQFPRNIYRNTPKAFAFDQKSLEIAQFAIRTGYDKTLSYPQRSFVYLPFQHSEDLSLQKISVELYEQLAKEWGKEGAPFIQSAKAHFKIIERFGRFPHRNKILGRQETEEERQYLASGGLTF